MIRIFALTFLLLSTVGCAKREPPVAGTEGPIEEPGQVVSIHATPTFADEFMPVKIVVTVSDTTGLMLPGRRVEIESSEPSDLLEPSAGETRASGVFVSTLNGTTAGTRIVTAKVGDETISVSVAFSIATSCEVGGQPPLAATWSENSRPVGILTGDLDGDGSGDVTLLLVDSSTGMGSTRIVVTLNGDAGAKTEATWPGEVWSPQLADFDGDGLPDLAFSEQGSLVVLLGNGDGTFREGARFEDDSTSPLWSSSVVVSGDTRAQLLVVSPSKSGANRLRALRLDDEGRWTILAESTGDELFFVGRAGDFNRDGFADYVLDTWGGPTFWMGSSDGTFEKTQAGPGTGTLVLVDDLDGNGTIDLLLYAWNDLEAWFGLGDGTFDVRSVQAEWTVGYEQFAVGHFDDDGVPDLFGLTVQTPRELRVFRGLGDGAFDLPISPGGLPLSTSTFAIVDQEAGPSSVALLGRASLAIMRPGGASFPSPAAGATWAFAIGDFDGDGISEIAYASHSPPSVSIWGQGGNWSKSYQASGNAYSLASGDLDGDGADEILVLRPANGEVRLFAISPATEIEYEIELESRDAGFWSSAVADFNGDGRGDIAVASMSSTVVLLSGEDGSYRQGPELPGGVMVVTGDFDGDGRPDLAIAGVVISIHLGDGTGGFAVGASFENDLLSPIAVGDLDLDGATDIVVGGGDYVKVISGLGPRGAARTEFYEVGGFWSSILTVGDFDGDAAPDIVARGTGEAISILWGKGDGGFRPAIDYPGGAQFHALAFGDFFGTERRDLVTLDPRGDLRLLPISCASPR